jgi:hypothetical protein
MPEHETGITIVATVGTIVKRDQLIKRIYTNLTENPSTQFTVQQDQVNRIKVFHNLDKGRRVLIRTYLIIIIPVTIDTSALTTIYGKVDFHLDETITSLQELISKLQSLQGTRFVKGNTNAKTFEKLVNQLRGVNGKY